jgi:hypothetical protein
VTEGRVVYVALGCEKGEEVGVAVGVAQPAMRKRTAQRMKHLRMNISPS